jgi:hypothetical protein
MADVDKHIIICPNFRATYYTEICILGFCGISGSIGRLDHDVD